MHIVVRFLTAAPVFLLLFVSSLHSQSASGSKFQFGFQVFTDYYHTLKHFNPVLKDSSGFDINRMNFTVEYKIDSSYDTRIRLESEDRVSILNNSVLAAFIKDLWLRYKFAGGKSELIFGIQQTPSYRLSEQNWGYRSIERMQQDFERLLGTRDFGIMFRSYITDIAPLRLSILLANNSSVARETDIRKRVYATLDLEQKSGWNATLSADYQRLPGETEGMGTSLYAGYLTGARRFGIEAFYHQKIRKLATPGFSVNNLYYRGISFFGNYSLRQDFDFLLRADFTSRSLGNLSQQCILFISGFDYHPNESVHIIPNITLQNETQNASATAIVKLTLNWEL